MLYVQSIPISRPCVILIGVSLCVVHRPCRLSVQADDEVANESTFDAIHDTEAFVAANDDVIIAVFRGSKGGRDWLTNLSVLPRDVPEEWKLETADGDLHRVGAY